MDRSDDIKALEMERLSMKVVLEQRPKIIGRGQLLVRARAKFWQERARTTPGSTYSGLIIILYHRVTNSGLIFFSVSLVAISSDLVSG